jgi:hypothetical protein
VADRAFCSECDPYDIRDAQDLVTEILELARDALIDVRGHAGDYLADKYDYEGDFDRLQARALSVGLIETKVIRETE